MRILIVGASGLVGGGLYKEFNKNSHQVVGTYNNFSLPNLLKLDITKKNEVEKTIKETKPDWILHPAAYADVEGCEKDPQFCRKINFDGVRNIVDFAKQNNIAFVFFSSDYIFDGLHGPYGEDDQANPLNIYGRVKLEMENYIKSNLNNYLIIRTCNVFGWEPQRKNFVVKLINKLKKGEQVKVVSDQFGSPTYAPNLSKAVIYLVEKQKHGVFHVAGKDVLDRYSFANLIAEVFGLTKSLIIPVTTNQINQVAKRPMKAGLRIDKVQKILPFKLPNAREGLEMMRREMV